MDAQTCVIFFILLLQYALNPHHTKKIKFLPSLFIIAIS